MAKNKLHWKPSKKFGMASGKYTKYRKCIRQVGRPAKRKYSYKCTIEQTNNMKMRLYRKIVAKSYKRRARQFISNVQKPRYIMQRISSDETLKFKLTKVNTGLNNKGYRMINLDSLQSHVVDITTHVVTCKQVYSVVEKQGSPISLVSELRTCGLASVLLAKCNGCGKTFQFETSPKLKHEGSTRYDINVRAVWGSVVTGNGASHLNEIMATMDSPGISQPAFTKLEEDIGSWWENVLQHEFQMAGIEERNIAIEKGKFHQGVPSITVIADGGWCKRSHKHSYNALGGVAIIIGKETGKILHMGVRSRYCYVCSRAQNQGIVAKPHTCHKNWSESAQAMEADVIVEGFLKAESVHGLRYMKLIGDGDSSVYAQIQEKVPIWGKFVEKVECANHSCKCLRSSLENLVEDNPSYKGRDKLSKHTRIRIVSAVRCAIRMRSNDVKTDSNKIQASKLLAHDIRNSINHIFGNHEKCSNFCKAKSSDKTTNSSSTDNNPPQISSSQTDGDNLSDLCSDMVDYWLDGTNIQAQEASRLGTSHNLQDLDTNMKRDVSFLLNRLAVKSDRLIDNATTNIAESWMHIRTKFDGGKVYNVCNRGSWFTRCYGGSLRMNLGPQWSPSVWETVTGTTPGHHYCKLYQEREKQLNLSTVSKRKPESSACRWKRKISSALECKTKKAKLSYGSKALDVVHDLNPLDLESCSTNYTKKHINISLERLNALERVTREQSLSSVWQEERKKRLTASNFGSILKRKPKLPVTPIVRRLLYSKFSGNQHTRKGLQEERVTIEEYKLKKADLNIIVEVEKVGLVVSKEHKFLAGSPDGKVVESGGHVGLIEIKNLLHNKPINLTKAAKIQKDFCLQISPKNILSLKQTHPYYFQCQGLMAITNLPWIDFVVRTLNPYQIHIERILRHENFWQTDMIPKLTAFYYKVLLPELSAPREGKYPGIREPGIWFEPNIEIPKDKCNKPASKKKPVAKNLKQPVNSANIIVDSATSLNPATSSKKASTSAKGFSTFPVADTNIISTPASTSSSSSLSTHVSRRRKKIKFVGRLISHEWIIDDTSEKTEWYKGTVLGVLSGSDGDPTAVYEILYEGEEEPHEVEKLYEDYTKSSVRFIDL